MIHDQLHALLRGESLTSDEMAIAMGRVMRGEVPESLLAAFLVALRLKGETAAEIAGAARAMREQATTIQAPQGPVIDTCGTGGDGSGTFNISTTAAFVVAACGGIVAKHGNHSNSSASGSADVLKALGVSLDVEPGQVECALREVGVGFLYAPRMHPAMRHAAAVRRELRTRTVFNLLGPLANPASASYQVVGVYDRALVPVMLEALRELGARGAMVVHGADGLDELTTCAETHVGELVDGKLRTYTLDARDLGLPRVKRESLRGGSPERNAAIARAVLQGERGPARDIVCLNAAAALKVAGLAPSLMEGLTMAFQALDDGRAIAKLEGLVTLTSAVAI